MSSTFVTWFPATDTGGGATTPRRPPPGSGRPSCTVMPTPCSSGPVSPNGTLTPGAVMLPDRVTVRGSHSAGEQVLNAIV